MARYQIITLVDITRSNPSRSESNKTKLGQQANFNSLIQSIGMRSNIEWDSDPKMTIGRIPDQDGKAAYWVWQFETERDQVFEAGGNPVRLLVDDLHNVPVVANLLNSKDIHPAAFQTKSDNANTWITII
jgi:hypothetical protein